jgi:hypothetical protein
VYRALDAAGNKAGAPIKASVLPCKPTLKKLEPLFQQGATSRQPHKQRLKTLIDWTIVNGNIKCLEQLSAALTKEQIAILFRQNKEGFVYGITFVDHKTRCVFNGSDLGKDYGAKRLQERLIQTPGKQKQSLSNNPTQQQTLQVKTVASPSIADTLLTPEQSFDFIPYQLKKKKKRKRKRIYL